MRYQIYRFYKLYISNIFKLMFPGTGCRFYPKCSEYSYLAFKKYNPLKAAIMSLVRILKCNGLYRGGIDYP